MSMEVLKRVISTSWLDLSGSFFDISVPIFFILFIINIFNLKEASRSYNIWGVTAKRGGIPQLYSPRLPADVNLDSRIIQVNKRKG